MTAKLIAMIFLKHLSNVERVIKLSPVIVTSYRLRLMGVKKSTTEIIYNP